MQIVSKAIILLCRNFDFYVDFRIQKALEIMNSPSGMTLEKFKSLWQQIPIPSELSTFTHGYDEDED